MRKINWLVGSVALCLGLVIGIVGHAVATTPATGSSILTKLGVDNESQATAINSENVLNSVKQSPNADQKDSLLTPPEGVLAGANETDSTVEKERTEKIISDYKQNIGYFFGAWQSTDMTNFRNQLAKAYIGEIYEKHARNAESFIIQGIGLAVSDIRFDEIKVESATANSATLEATYRYAAQDYDLGEQMPQGEKTEHLVHVRVNLILSNGHWLISGETLLS
ncbi:hypothetical protein [Desulfitobacterium sp.]|uniref:hypothetical protein n=1 Tax=Desulfitobacterium sp. TaxID=49981 RepID=UPI002B1FD8CD|nr:hypothetical protein [Desulfitobacterium sp.]MEA4901460.1 hypothetical protein [Desulfitobacterium sp.]